MRALALMLLVALAGCDFVPEQTNNRADVPVAGSGNAMAPPAEEVGAAPVAAPTPTPTPTPAVAADADGSDASAVASAGAPSFSCRPGMGAAETLICNDARLAQLDRRLTRAYADVRADADASTRAELLRDQREFLADRDDCEDAGCIAAVYRDRMAALQRTAASAEPSCRAEIGELAAARLVRQCMQASPATHPPCNAANSCAMIQSEIDRSCALFEEGDDIPGFCRR